MSDTQLECVTEWQTGVEADEDLARHHPQHARHAAGEVDIVVLHRGGIDGTEHQLCLTAGATWYIGVEDVLTALTTLAVGLADEQCVIEQHLALEAHERGRTFLGANRIGSTHS